MKNKVIVLIVVAIVILGGGYFAYTKYSGKSGDSAGSSTVKESNNTNNAKPTASGTFASLVARGENLTCTFEYNDNTSVTSGTVYIADKAKRIRGDFNIKKSAGGPMQVTMIRVDGYNHIWSSAFSQGVKTKVTAEEENKLLSDKDSGVDENTEFECSSWTVDSAKFTLPAGMSFMDLSAQMQIQGQ